MAGCWSTQDPILSNKQFLDSIGSSDFGNQLHNFWVVVSTITTNYEKSIFWSLGDSMENGSDEVLGVMWLLKHYDLLAETGATQYINLVYGLRIGAGWLK